MAIFEWDDTISLHIPVIDKQHRELLSWISALNESVQKGEGAQVIGDVLLKLISYVCFHFEEEERLLLAANYPDFVSHRKEHDDFVKRLREIQEHFQDGEELSRNTLEFMSDWIVLHIRGTDQKYGQLVRARMGAAR
ncbi:MAG TPA: bacteriohemerythrin, partial [Desulfuromonadaceae bacterium]